MKVFEIVGGSKVPRQRIFTLKVVKEFMGKNSFLYSFLKTFTNQVMKPIDFSIFSVKELQ